MKILWLPVTISVLLIAFSGCSILSRQKPPESASTDAFPGQNGWDPTVACAHLSDKLTPGAYKNEGNNLFRCVSATKNLDASTPPNNIVYYAKGEAQRARQVGLVLNVNNPGNAGDALRTLVEYSDALSTKALGVPLSHSATRAILAGNPGRGMVDTTRVEVLRQNFADGKGYEMHYVITPRL